MRPPEHDVIQQEKMDVAADNFMHVVDTAASGCSRAVLGIIHADKQEFVNLHLKLMRHNVSYQDAFNAYSKATNSPSGRALERKIHIASSKGNMARKLCTIFAAATAHLPTCIAIMRSEKKIEQAFRDNYKPKM